MSGGQGNESRMGVEIRGEDLETSRRLALEVQDLLQTTPGIADPRLARDEARPEMAVQIDRPKAALFGLNTTQVANTIRTNVAGTVAAQFRQGGYEYPIIVRLKQEDREQVSDVNDVMVNTASGVSLPVRNVMVIQSQLGPSQIDRKNQERMIMVSAEPEIPLSQAVKAVQARLPEINRPQEFSIGFGAEVEQQEKTFNELRLVLILALILVYAVMASQYESLRDPFIIMFSVPTAAIGVVLALYLTDTSFNLQAYLGVIMLGGIVVSNAILLVDYTNILRRRDGMELREAVEVAGTHAAAADSDDLAGHDARPRADGPRHRRRQRAAGAAGARRHRRPSDLHLHHPGVRADGVHAVRRGMGGAVEEAPASAGRRALTCHRSFTWAR